jgi:hypothetical protein
MRYDDSFSEALMRETCVEPHLREDCVSRAYVRVGQFGMVYLAEITRDRQRGEDADEVAVKMLRGGGWWPHVSLCGHTFRHAFPSVATRFLSVHMFPYEATLFRFCGHPFL